jgi:hypothetical protein
MLDDILRFIDYLRTSWKAFKYVDNFDSNKELTAFQIVISSLWFHILFVSILVLMTYFYYNEKKQNFRIKYGKEAPIGYHIFFCVALIALVLLFLFFRTLQPPVVSSW